MSSLTFVFVAEEKEVVRRTRHHEKPKPSLIGALIENRTNSDALPKQKIGKCQSNVDGQKALDRLMCGAKTHPCKASHISMSRLSVQMRGWGMPRASS